MTERVTITNDSTGASIVIDPKKQFAKFCQAIDLSSEKALEKAEKAEKEGCEMRAKYLRRYAKRKKEIEDSL